RQGGDVAHTAALGEYTSQGGAARQAAQAPAEGIVHALPFFATRCGDELRRRVLFRPFAGALMERIGPGQDLLVRQSGEALLVTHAAPRRQQARQRRAPRQTSATLL